MKRLIVALFSSAFVLALPAAADVGFQFVAGGTPAPKAGNVDGARIVLFYGDTERVHGFDLGIIALSEASEFSGFSMHWGLARVRKHSAGLATAFVNVHTGEDTGVNAAFINSVESLEKGANFGFVNITRKFSNVDVSGLAISDHSNVQVGFVNITKKIDRLQIGFLNFAENGLFPVMPFFNIPKK